MNIKKNDTVVVLSGKDKGTKGKVLVAMPADNKVVVEKVNVATCHTKPRRQGEQARDSHPCLQGCSVLPQVRQRCPRRLQGRERHQDSYLP